jgi:hypothetical protein
MQWASFLDDVPQVGDAIRFDHAGALQFERSMIEPGKESDAVSEEHREIEACLTEETCPQVLLSHVGGTDRDVSIASDELASDGALSIPSVTTVPLVHGPT